VLIELQAISPRQFFTKVPLFETSQAAEPEQGSQLKAASNGHHRFAQLMLVWDRWTNFYRYAAMPATLVCLRFHEVDPFIVWIQQYTHWFFVSNMM